MQISTHQWIVHRQWIVCRAMDLLIPVLKWSMNHFQWTHRSTHLVTKKIESSIVVLYLLTVVLCAFKVLQIYMCSNRVNSGWADRKIHATNAWSTYKICHFTMHRTMPAIIWQRQYMHHTINDLDWVKKVCCKSTIRLVGCICSGSLRTSENKKNACFRQSRNHANENVRLLLFLWISTYAHFLL